MNRAEELVPTEGSVSTDRFLSDITGLPVTNYVLFPELNMDKPSVSGQDKYPHTFQLDLGCEGDQYSISCSIDYANSEGDPYWYNTETNWVVKYNGRELYGKSYTTVGSTSMMNGYSVEEAIPNLNDALHEVIGGPSYEVPFMDYEQNTLREMRSEGYFSSAYLTIMTHMKERGLSMPPILSKDRIIREAVEIGDVNEVKRLTDIVKSDVKTSMEARCSHHVEYEIKKLLQVAEENRMRRDPFVPIEQSFPYIEVSKVTQGEARFGSPNILSVENYLWEGGSFPDSIVNALEKDGRFLGSRVVRGFSIGEVAHLCASGKINLIIFDQINPDPWELLYLQGERDESFDESNGEDTQGVISFDEEVGFQINLADGRLMDPRNLKNALEGVDLREEWMSVVRRECAKLDIKIPPYVIVRSDDELERIPEIAASIIGRPKGK